MTQFLDYLSSYQLIKEDCGTEFIILHVNSPDHRAVYMQGEMPPKVTRFSTSLPYIKSNLTCSKIVTISNMKFPL